MRPLKIAHLSTQTGWRGGEQQLTWLAQGLARLGHSCLVIANESGELVTRGRSLGLEVQPVPVRGEVGFTSVRETASALREYEPDIVHLHDAHAVLVGSLAGKLCRCPAIVASRRVDFRIRSRWKYSWALDRVIAISAAVRAVLIECGLEPRLISVVPSGIDLARFEKPADRAAARRALKLSEDEPAVVVVAALTDHKGHRYLLEGWPRVLERHSRAKLLLAGRGELEEELKELAERLGLSGSVRFLGFCDDVTGLLAAADLFALSSHLEGLCTSLMDAMAAGLAVVATEAGGIPEVVDPDRTGVLVRPKDPRALAEAISALLADPERRRRLGAAGRTKAHAEFGHGKMVERTVAVYQQVLAAKGLL